MSNGDTMTLKPWERFAKKPPKAEGPWMKFKDKPAGAALSVAPVKAATVTPTAGTRTGEALAPEEKLGAFSEFGKGIERTFGIDTQKMIQAFHGKDVEGLGGTKRHLTGAQAQWTEFGEQFTDNLRKFGLSVLKDPLKISEAIEGMASTVEAGVKKTASGLTEANMGTPEFREKTFGGLGEIAGGIGQILGGAEGVEELRANASLVDGGIKAAHDIATKTGKDVGEATSTAARLSEGVPNRVLRRRAFEDAYVHAKGLQLGQRVGKAAKAIHDEVEVHAGGIASQIDTKIPTGVVDASAESAVIQKEFYELVKTPDLAKPILVQMVRDAKQPPGMWSWEKARQFRSSVGRAINKTEGPQRAVLTRVYQDLTRKLKTTAYKYGLGKSWEQYNKLAEMSDRQYGDLIDDLRSAQSGQEVAQKLSKDVGRTSEFARNLSKYGLDAQDVLKFTKQAQKILRNRGFWNKTLFRLAYGSPIGAPVMIFARLAGAPWMAGLGVGAGVGLATSYLVNLARVMRMSPEVIEHMMKERELPGKMPFESGVFPEGAETPEPSAPGSGDPKPKGPSVLPAPKPQGGHAGGGVASVEELARSGRFVKISKTGAPTDLGKSPDFGTLKPDEAAYQVKPDGTVEYKAGTETDATKAGVKRYAEGVYGKGKLAEQAKARERVAKSRATAKRTKASEAAETKARAQATGLDVNNLQIPEMEEHLRTVNRAAFGGLQKLRKAKGITDSEYIEALKYYILEHFESK